MALRPTDKLIGGYVAFVSTVMLVRGEFVHGSAWALLAMHVLVGVLLYLFTQLGPRDTIGAVLHDLYPLLLLGPLYGEIGMLSGYLGSVRVFHADAMVQRWEDAVFGMQVAYEWIRRAPSVFWSGLLHLAYFSYYPIIVLGPLLLVLKGRRTAARHVLGVTMLAFVACYVVFVLFPVAGPNYAFPHPTGPVREVWSAKLVYGVLAKGSSFGAAFPSSHVAATLAAVIALWSEWRGLAVAFTVPTLLLVVGTVYCQMHYGVDTLTGLAVGATAGWAGARMFRAGRASRPSPL